MNAFRQDLIRSVAQECGPVRAVAYHPTTYSAFQISEGGKTYSLEPLDARTLQEALGEALSQVVFSHKQHLLIRTNGVDGVKLSLFAIKRKSKARYVFKDHQTTRVHDLYAAPVTTIDAGVIA
jgi:hypothetical protein